MYLASRWHMSPNQRKTPFAHNPIAQKGIMRRREMKSIPEKQKRFAIGEPLIRKLAGCTGLEPATSDVTGRRSNQLS